MSRKYQGLIILNTKNHEGSIDDLLSTISKEFEAEGAKVEKFSQLGRREFAYPLKHLAGGQYVNFNFTAEGDAISKIQARLKLHEQIHLHQFERVA